MFCRSFLEASIALIPERVGGVRLKADSDRNAARYALCAPGVNSTTRDQALARAIARQYGIVPMASLLIVLHMAMTPGPAIAQSGQVRATVLATARATILPSSASIIHGRLQTQPGSSPTEPNFVHRPTSRACDSSPQAPSSPCRMIVYDLP